MSGSYTNDLFSEPARSWDILEQQEYRLNEQVEHLSAADLNAHSISAIIEGLGQRFSLNVPVLHEEAATATHQEIDLDPQRRSILGQPRYERGLRITVAVPFTGDRRIFDLRPDTYEDLPAPKGLVVGDTVNFTTEGARLTAQEVRAEYDAWLALVNRHLALHREKLGGFNERLHGTIEAALTARAERLREHADLVNSLGFSSPPLLSFDERLTSDERRLT